MQTVDAADAAEQEGGKEEAVLEVEGSCRGLRLAGSEEFPRAWPEAGAQGHPKEERIEEINQLSDKLIEKIDIHQKCSIQKFFEMNESKQKAKELINQVNILKYALNLAKLGPVSATTIYFSTFYA